jgi:EAL domain-containing protein (putative c-di-GMP-specific phosphodiesterase class I)
VEVSDRRLADVPSGVVDVLSRLRGLGVHVCLDEFGVGEASLANVRRCAVDRVKLDRSFVAGVADDPGARLVAGSLLKLGESLGLVVVAAGVETRSQRTQLERMGFTLAQGNLWAPALPPGGVLDSVFGRTSG